VFQNTFFGPQEEHTQALTSQDAEKCTYGVKVLVRSFILVSTIERLSYGSPLGLKYAFRVCA
jgi:hypothetical protein